MGANPRVALLSASSIVSYRRKSEAHKIREKHTEVEVEVDIAPRSACSEAVIEFADKHYGI
jgi:phosphotransacetylase